MAANDQVKVKIGVDDAPFRRGMRGIGQRLKAWSKRMATDTTAHWYALLKLGNYVKGLVGDSQRPDPGYFADLGTAHYGSALGPEPGMFNQTWDAMIGSKRVVEQFRSQSGITAMYERYALDFGLIKKDLIMGLDNEKASAARTLGFTDEQLTEMNVRDVLKTEEMLANLAWDTVTKAAAGDEDAKRRKELSYTMYDELFGGEVAQIAWPLHYQGKENFLKEKQRYRPQDSGLYHSWQAGETSWAVMKERVNKTVDEQVRARVLGGVNKVTGYDTPEEREKITQATGVIEDNTRSNREIVESIKGLSSHKIQVP